MKTHSIFLLILLIVLGGWWGRPVPAVSAHGGGTMQVAGAAAGPYRVTVWTAPSVARAGNPFHVTVAVASADGQDPILDAEVMVSLSPLESGESTLTRAATTDQSANKLYYETDFTVANGGLYEVRVSVRGPQGEGAVSFETELEPARNANWFWVAGLAGLGIIVAVGLFRVWQDRP